MEIKQHSAGMDLLISPTSLAWDLGMTGLLGPSSQSKDKSEVWVVAGSYSGAVRPLWGAPERSHSLSTSSLKSSPCPGH